MNIDERIEALTQTVERLAQMHQSDHEHLEELREITKQLKNLTGEVVALQSRMARILESHDGRLDRLEGE